MTRKTFDLERWWRSAAAEIIKCQWPLVHSVASFGFFLSSTQPIHCLSILCTVGTLSSSSPSVISASFCASGCTRHQVHSVVVQFLCIFDRMCVWLPPCLFYLLPPPRLYSLSSPLPFQLFSSSVPPFPLMFVARPFFLCLFSLFLPSLFLQHLLIISSPAAHPSPSLSFSLLSLSFLFSGSVTSSSLFFPVWVAWRCFCHSFEFAHDLRPVQDLRGNIECTLRSEMALMRRLPLWAFTWTCEEQAVKG